MIRSAITIGRISMTGDHNLDAHFGRALQGRVKVVNLKPKQHTVSIWLVITIPDRAVMVFYSEVVQLKYKLAVRDQLFICGAPMITPAAE
jgi:hypothetical protein